MKLNKIFTLLAFGCIVLSSCSDEVKKKTLDFPNDVTFNKEENSIDIEVPELQFVQLDAPFTARAYNDGAITFNAKKNADGTHTGFALSNKNYRSYPWCISINHGVKNPTKQLLQEATDSSLFSVYSGSYPNQLKNFTVVRVEGEEAFFTIDRPRVVEHVIIANCTFNYLAMTYGSVFSGNLNEATNIYEPMKNGKLSVVRNPNLPDPSTKKYDVWNLPDYYNFGQGEAYSRMAPKDKATGKGNGYFKVIAIGYNAGKMTAKSEYYLAVRPGVATVAPYDKWDIIQNFWAKWDLSSLGEVDKVIFTLDGSEKAANGKLKTAPYFCMDGIRLK
ncbi:MAG: DUF4465 domain-containing protein [Bacteroidales bacterium]